MGNYRHFVSLLLAVPNPPPMPGTHLVELVRVWGQDDSGIRMAFGMLQYFEVTLAERLRKLAYELCTLVSFADVWVCMCVDAPTASEIQEGQYRPLNSTTQTTSTGTTNTTTTNTTTTNTPTADMPTSNAWTWNLPLMDLAIFSPFEDPGTGPVKEEPSD